MKSSPSVPPDSSPLPPRPSKKRISVAAGKAKGRNLQKWVRDLLLSLFPSLEDGDIRSTAMGQSGEDIQLSPAARKQIPLSIECKSYAKIAVYARYQQASQNCPKNAEPIVVMKADRQKPLVLVDAEWFFKRIQDERCCYSSGESENLPS